MASDPLPTILIVDDDEGLTRLIAKSLKRQGFVCLTALTGTAAIACLDANPDVALLLLDLKLPDVSEKDLLDHLAAMPRPVPFVVITGQGDERVAVEMMKRGALDYLIKDSQFLELVPMMVQRSLSQLDRETRLMAAEAALRREHDFSMAILRTAGALMVVADAEGRVVSVNPACERLMGGTLQELRDQDFGRLFLAGTPGEEAVQKQIEKMVSPSAPYEQEAYLTARGGERRLIAWSITALANDRGTADYIIASGIDITDRRRLEQEILEVSDREQKRIGQDLHDGLCQVLAGIDMLAVVLKNKLTEKARPEAVDADIISGYVREAINQARVVSRGLSPVELETHGLMAALEELASGTQKLFKVGCEFTCPKTVLIRDNAKATHLYRIAQEAISNAIKHGHATSIQLTLTSAGGRGSLVISDNGCGIATPGKTASRAKATKGMGLRTMDYRTAMIGGTLRIKHGNPHGTTVICSFPAESSVEKEGV